MQKQPENGAPKNAIADLCDVSACHPLAGDGKNVICRNPVAVERQCERLTTLNYATAGESKKPSSFGNNARLDGVLLGAWLTVRAFDATGGQATTGATGHVKA